MDFDHFLKQQTAIGLPVVTGVKNFQISAQETLEASGRKIVWNASRPTIGGGRTFGVGKGQNQGV